MKPYFLDEHEKILWQNKPSKLMYLFNGFNLFVFLFLIVWSTIVITIGGHFFQSRMNLESWISLSIISLKHHSLSFHWFP